MMILETVTFLPEMKGKDPVKNLKAHPGVVKKLVRHQRIPAQMALFNIGMKNHHLKCCF
jgi:DNA-directed RNA polymerase subunit H (RpoH/RPB5)